MRAVVFAWIACAGCDTLFHLDHVPLPGDGGAGSDAPLGDSGDHPNLVFVSSQQVVPASLGGAAAADILCSSLARQAGHPGRYIAWLGTSAQSATARIGATARGWVRVDGKPFADTLVDIVQGHVWYPLRLTESGDDVVATGNASDLVVVTGTNADGSTQLDTCGDYTTQTIAGVSAGLADAAPFGWNANMGAACTQSVRLYCFGVDHVAPVTITPESTRLAFVTDDTSEAGLGLSTFDQLCAAAATTAQLSGTFKAALATTTTPAIARFTNGGPWVRRDGVTVIDRNGTLTAPIELDAGGASQTSTVVWNGAPSLLTKAPSSSASCFDWARNDTTLGLSGNTSRSSGDGFGGIGNPCVNSLGVYCLQD